MRNLATPVIAAALLLVAPAPDAPTADVLIFDFRFQPASMTVTTGTRVIWTMGPDPEQHTVTPDESGTFPDSPILQPGDPGDRWELRFDAVGTFRYHCFLHPDMIGIIEIIAAPAGSSRPTSSLSPIPPGSPPPSPDQTSPPTDATRPTGGAVSPLVAIGLLGGLGVLAAVLLWWMRRSRR